MLDFSYSVKGKEVIKAVTNEYRYMYPKEIFDKEIPTGVTDIYTVVHSIFWLLPEHKMPLFMKRFFNGCLKYRHYDALSLHREFDTLVQEYYGKPKYVELKMKGE